MSRKIFWSWQNDYAPEANRYFVRDALSVAIDGLNEELEIEDADRLDLDEARKDEAGAPEMARAILEKILQAAVFVADLTPIAELPPRPDKGKKKRKALPNPNVLFELGYALKALGEEKIIMILNKASDFEPEELPFDIKNRYVLMYEYEEDTGEATKKEAAKKLSEKLKEDIERCLKHHEPAASEQEIRGVEAMEGDPSIWATSADPFSYRSRHHHGKIEKVYFPQGEPRGYLRIIPVGWKNGIPHPYDIETRPWGERVQADYRRCEERTDCGRCEEGFVDLPIAVGKIEKVGDKNAAIKSEDAVMWFKETGEYWIINGSAIDFFDRKAPTSLNVRHLIRGWDRALEAGMKAFDSLGALPERRVEAGLVGIIDIPWQEDCFLSNQEYYPGGYVETFGNKILVSCQQANWNDEAQHAFLHDVCNKICDRYGLDPIDRADFEMIIGISSPDDYDLFL